MEIIHLILGKANPERMNGVNKVVFHLASAQALMGSSVAVWGISKDTNKNYADRAFATRIFQGSGNSFFLSKRLEQAINNSGNDVVFHVHGGFIPAFYRAAQLFVKAKKKYVYTPHGAFNSRAMEKSRWLKKIYFGLFEKKIIKHAEAVHCIGASEVSALKSLISTAKTVLIPNGQNATGIAYSPVPKKANSEVLTFGFCGRIDIETKGLDLLLKGFSVYLK